MEQYIMDLKLDLEQCGKENKQFKNKQVFYDSEIYRISHQNMRMMHQLGQREDIIKQMEQEIQRLNIAYR